MQKPGHKPWGKLHPVNDHLSLLACVGFGSDPSCTLDRAGYTDHTRILFIIPIVGGGKTLPRTTTI
eukprot:scaffold649080_cov45-Prasinocladus_malaysianus.AAC.1